MATSRFTLRQLEIFAAVVRSGQVKRAAAGLHLSQAAVSQALRELSDGLGVPLFERRGRELVATPAARQLLQLATGPMAALHEIPARLAPGDRDAPLTGHLQLAASNTIAHYILPWELARLQRAHPDLDVNVLSSNSEVVERCVAALEADIGFIEGPPRREDLEVATWRTDTLQIIAPRDYPVAGVRLDALDRHPWVARESGSGTRAVFEQNLALAGFTIPHARLVLDDSGAIVRAVAAGAGLACLSRRVASAAHAAGEVRYVDCAPLSLQRPLWLIRRTAAGQEPLVDRFLQALQPEPANAADSVG